MLLDELLEFADATVVAAAAGTALIGDVIDLGAPGYGGVPNVLTYAGDIHPMYLIIQVSTQIITGGTAGTVQFALASDAQAAIATDGTATIHYITRGFLTDDATALGVDVALGFPANADSAGNIAGGTLACIALPNERYERYLGILCVTATTTTTAGAINAFLTRTPARYVMHQDSLPSGS